MALTIEITSILALLLIVRQISWHGGYERGYRAAYKDIQDTVTIWPKLAKNDASGFIPGDEVH
jgi:hypothetical protein